MSSYADPTIVAQRSSVTYQDLGLANQGALDSLIASLNTRVGSLIDRACSHDFAQHVNQVDTLDGTNKGLLLLTCWPVLSVQSVTEDGAALNPTDYRLTPGSAGHLGGGTLERRDFLPWTRAWAKWQVTYTWGWTAVPDEIKQVAEDVLLRLLQAAKVDRDAAGASSWSMDGFSTTLDRRNLQGTLTSDELQVLGAYRAVA